MIWNQNETGRIRSSEFGMRKDCDALTRHSAVRNPRSAFTLTELLVVITIIAILASLITGAAINALNKAKQAAITLEMQQIGGAMEDLKNEFGAYPPNVFPNADPPPGFSDDEKQANARRLQKYFRKAFSRGNEFSTNLGSPPIRNANAALDNLFPIYQAGLSPAEAVVFWLQGFSQDPSRPITGTDREVTSLENQDNSVDSNVITIESTTPRFDFDRGRLRISRNPLNNERRVLLVNDANGNLLQIQLYEYLAPGSEQPYVYFDTSRETPQQVVNNWEAREFFYSDPDDSSQIVFPLKQLRADTPSNIPAAADTLEFVEYVERGKFQILHCGLDDLWGDFSISGVRGELNVANTSGDYDPNLLLAPTGPFIGDIADTLGHFMTGTLEDKQE